MSFRQTMCASPSTMTSVLGVRARATDEAATQRRTVVKIDRHAVIEVLPHDLKAFHNARLFHM